MLSQITASQAGLKAMVESTNESMVHLDIKYDTRTSELEKGLAEATSKIDSLLDDIGPRMDVVEGAVKTVQEQQDYYDATQVKQQQQLNAHEEQLRQLERQVSIYVLAFRAPNTALICSSGCDRGATT